MLSETVQFKDTHENKDHWGQLQNYISCVRAAVRPMLAYRIDPIFISTFKKSGP